MEAGGSGKWRVECGCGAIFDAWCEREVMLQLLRSGCAHVDVERGEMCDGARQHVNTCMVGVEVLCCTEKGERADDATKHEFIG